MITLHLDEKSLLDRTCEIEIERDVRAAMAAVEKVLAKEMAPMKQKVSTDDVSHLLAKLSGLRIPPVPDGIMGLDGTTYTLRIVQMFNAASYTWWEASPKGWEGLEEVAQRMIGLSHEIEKVMGV